MNAIKNALEVYFFLMLGFAGTSVALLIAWLRARERAIRAESFLEGSRTLPAQPETVAPALDAIALEVERIGEGQRFLTRVLADQTGRAEVPAKRPAASITPH